MLYDRMDDILIFHVGYEINQHDGFWPSDILKQELKNGVVAVIVDAAGLVQVNRSGILWLRELQQFLQNLEVELIIVGISLEMIGKAGDTDGFALYADLDTALAAVYPEWQHGGRYSLLENNAEDDENVTVSDCKIIRIRGDLDGVKRIQSHEISPKSSGLIVDLNEVTHYSSVGIGWVVTVCKIARERNVPAFIVSSRKELRRILDLVRIHTVGSMVLSIAEAMDNIDPIEVDLNAL